MRENILCQKYYRKAAGRNQLALAICMKYYYINITIIKQTMAGII